MKLAVVTAAYPSAKFFFEDFFISLREQTDQKFDLWIGLDGISPCDFDGYCNLDKQLNFHKVTEKASPVVVRNQTLRRAVEHADTLVLVDIDDVLFPTRVEAARHFAEKFELSATAMNFIDSHSKLVSGVFDPSKGDPELIENNVFGFSNTTWRSSLLADLLPVPEDCVTMDWYVATLARIKGAIIGFDVEPRMYYRQYEANMAHVLSPFSDKQVLVATMLVLKHFSAIMHWLEKNDQAEFLERYLTAYNRIEKFNKSMANPDCLKKYVLALNRLPNSYVWWSCVANACLEEIWMK
ncbi:MAG: hypothetical protein GQF41_0493 [Candidatus Rifleibacterium amylolyticum]|nr:MAG: hypothetical protein GQF41_0493 [Candidatus Rifleibacterium amylolyticum]